jgi:hypothetical protein
MRFLDFGLSITTTLGSVVLGARPPFDAAFLADESLWGDGKAELSWYDATEVRYKEPRVSEVRHILVREDFAPDALVKADDWRRPGTYRVFKHVQILSIPTGVYRYEQAVNCFWRAADGQCLKISHVTNDSCGLTYKLGERAGDNWQLRAFTYWEGMVETAETKRLPADAVFYDELPFLLRSLQFADGLAWDFRMMDSMIGSRSQSLEWKPARLRVLAQGAVWQVAVEHHRGQDTFEFSQVKPHGLLAWARWDGSSLKLRETQRLPYWELNRTSDERLVPGRSDTHSSP